MEMYRKLPNATATLVLGILSIVTCCCYGIPGLIMGIIALAISQKDVKMYNESPDSYTDYGNLKAGRITAIIGISLSVMSMILYAVYFYYVLTLGPERVQEILEEIAPR